MEAEPVNQKVEQQEGCPWYVLFLVLIIGVGIGVILGVNL